MSSVFSLRASFRLIRVCVRVFAPPWSPLILSDYCFQIMASHVEINPEGANLAGESVYLYVFNG